MMLQEKKLIIQPQAIIEYIWAFFVILNGNSVYHASAGRDYHFPLICTILSALLLLTISKSSRIKERRVLLTTILLAIYCFIYFIIKYNTVSKEIYFLGYVISLPLLFLYFVTLKRIGKIEILFARLENIVLILAVVSLIVWLSGPIFNIIAPNTEMVISWGRLRTIEGYFGIQYITQYDNTIVKGLVRNTSIFCEGPMFSLWLSIALSTEMFLKEKSSWKKICILVVTIVTTTSVTGVFTIAICLGLKYIMSVDSIKKRKFVLISLLCLTCLPIIGFFIYDIIVNKMATASYLIRMQDYVAGFLLWKNNPILGGGFGNLSTLQKYILNSITTNVGFSNSVMAILGTGGLWNFFIYIVSVIAPMLGNYEKKKHRVAFALIYCYLTITTIFFARYIAVVFIAFGVASLPIFGNREERDSIEKTLY